MALLLCHECYCWVEPYDGRCRECWHALDAAVPDPPPAALEQALGRLMMRLGEVRVRRKTLPDRGTLYATTTGLLFLPHEPDRVTRMVDAGPTTESLILSLAALFWSPLHLIALWPRKNAVRPMNVRVFRPRVLTSHDSSRLPEFLMQNPGVFFVPQKSIRSATRRFHSWRIERSVGSKLKLRPEGDKPLFHRRFERLVATENWSGGERLGRWNSPPPWAVPGSVE
jgi:hypothetical protein